jgi:hypothetical protein
MLVFAVEDVLDGAIDIAQNALCLTLRLSAEACFVCDVVVGLICRPCLVEHQAHLLGTLLNRSFQKLSWRFSAWPI